MSFKRFQRRLVRILAVLVALSVLFCIGLYAYRRFFGYNYDSSLFEEDLAAGVQADRNITNIALFGLDTRPGETKSHSDCMMIVSVDNTRGKIKLISLMRDSLVPIDGYGSDKLNAAYYAGGPSLAIRTINENFGTDITEYIAVNFEQLVEIIDALDGVEINVQQEELAELNRVIRDYGIEQGKEFAGVQNAGKQTLGGVQALCYGRIRKGTGDDWARVERQGIVLNAMFQKVQTMNANRLIGLMQKLVPYVTTSLSATELAPLIVGAVQDGVPAFEHTRIPLDGEWYYSGPSNTYIEYDLDIAADHIHAYIYNDVAPGKTDANDGAAAGEPMDGMDFDQPPIGPVVQQEAPQQTVDPASLAEEGGSYDPATGDYRDSDGDYYKLNPDGSRSYYDQESYQANLAG